jgi:hypothetical protein
MFPFSTMAHKCSTSPAHTPGPWHHFGIKTDAPMINAGDDITVAVVSKEWTTEQEKEANVALIAAAPGLLTWLKHCYEVESALQRESRALSDEDFRAIAHVLARAEGLT